MTDVPGFDLDTPEQRRQLIAATRCAATDDARPVLAGLMFDHAGAWAIDSYRLVHVPVATGLPAPTADELAEGLSSDRRERERIVPAARFAKALREATRKSDRLRVDLGDEAVRVTVTRLDPVGGLTRVERLVTVELPYVGDPDAHRSGGTTYPDVRALIPAGVLDDSREAREQRLAELRDRRRPALALPYVDGVADVLDTSTMGAQTPQVVLDPTVVDRDRGDELLRPVQVYGIDGRWAGMVMPLRTS